MEKVLVWCNNNEGFVVAIFSLLGVVANVIAVLFSGFALHQTKQQIEKEVVFQKQNIGMTLYPLRREILKLFSERKYSELLIDAVILFTKDTNEKIRQVIELFHMKRECLDTIDEYEKGMLEFSPELYAEYKEIEARISGMDSEDPYEGELLAELYELCKQYKPIIRGEIVVYQELYITSSEINEKYNQQCQETYEAIRNEIQQSIIAG